MIHNDSIWICRACGKRVFRFGGGAVHYVYKVCDVNMGWTGHIKTHYPWIENTAKVKTWTLFLKHFRTENIKYMEDLDLR